LQQAQAVLRARTSGVQRPQNRPKFLRPQNKFIFRIVLRTIGRARQQAAMTPQNKFIFRIVLRTLKAAMAFEGQTCSKQVYF